MKLFIILLCSLVGIAIAWVCYIVLRKPQQPPQKTNNASGHRPVHIERAQTAGRSATPPRPGKNAGLPATPSPSPPPSGADRVPDEHLREARLASVTVDTPQGQKNAAEGFRLEGRREIRLEIVLRPDEN